MQIKYILLLTFISTFLVANSQRQVTEIDSWKFKKGNSPQAHQSEFDDKDWENVTVPHDWAIGGPFIEDGDGNTGKLPWKGEGWYRTTLQIPESSQEKIYYLMFDGVMAFPKVYVNGQLAGKWDYGYNSFYLNISDHIMVGEENLIAVHADTRPHDSRWYPGAGIYRKVQLITTHPLHVDIWGTYITTPVIKPHYADIRIATSIQNMADASLFSIKHSIINDDQQIVEDVILNDSLGRNSQKVLETTITLPNPRRWDIDDPHLYKLMTEIYVQDQLIDQYESSFGIRDIRFSSDHGFYLNDRRVQMYGVNLHHDLGPLGAAFNKRAMERQLQIMKSMGVNAVRNSHNTAAPELLELCDEMGILVFDEIFDKYDQKADILDTTDFEAFAHRNVRNFIKRDRNHPSVFLWSVGNEIGDVQYNIDRGFWKLNTMLGYVAKYDPTRPTTLVNDNQASAALRHFEFYDVHAWNYGRRYSLARQLEPNKSVIISESASTLSTRGFYEFPLPEDKTNFTNSLQVSSYDLNAPYWAEVADDDFMWQQEEPYIAGEFIWTGFDYLGEPTPYNNRWVKQRGMTDVEASRSSYFGVVDLVGIPKDRYYLYKSYWKPEENMIHILPHWNWSERIGQNVPVFVYTNGDCAELFVNGESKGIQCKDPKSNNSTERFRLMWKDVIYQPGEINAVAYKEGKKISEATVKTAGTISSIRLSPDKASIEANGKDLSYVLVDALDKDGNLQPLADNMVHIKISGPGKLAGVGNGNPQSFNSFHSETIPLFYGKAMIIIQSTKEKGSIKVEISSEGLKTQKLSIITR